LPRAGTAGRARPKLLRARLRPPAEQSSPAIHWRRRAQLHGLSARCRPPRRGGGRAPSAVRWAADVRAKAPGPCPGQGCPGQAPPADHLSSRIRGLPCPAEALTAAPAAVAAPCAELLVPALRGHASRSPVAARPGRTERSSSMQRRFPLSSQCLDILLHLNNAVLTSSTVSRKEHKTRRSTLSHERRLCIEVCSVFPVITDSRLK
jgi:hypothetical protein